MSAAGKRYMARVASLPCVLCARLGQHTEGVHVHHIREGHGMAQRASDFLTIPLCPEHHTGRDGIHGTRAVMRIAKVGELDLLADTIEALADD